MSLYQLRRRVNALYRKLAPELAVVRLRSLAEDYCDEWAVAVADGQEPPPVSPAASPEPDAPCHLEGNGGGVAAETAKPKTGRQPEPFIRRIAAAGFHLDTFMALQKYLERCRSQGKLPGVREIIDTLLPWARPGGYLECLRWDAPARA